MIGTGHKIVFQFNVPVSSVDPVIAEDAQSPIFPNMTGTLSGNEVIVALTGFADNQRIKLTLPSVQASNGSVLGNVTAAAGFLVGDVNRSNAVNASDLVGIKAHLNQTVERSNFRFDLNASGTVDAADVSAAKARSGQALP